MKIAQKNYEFYVKIQIDLCRNLCYYKNRENSPIFSRDKKLDN